MCANPEKRPAISRGQHQLPTKAGTERSIVPIATHMDVRSELSSSSSPHSTTGTAGG